MCTTRVRFHVDDPELALTLAAGALLSLNRLLHDQPERDDAQATDRLVENLLRVYGPARRRSPGNLPSAASGPGSPRRSRCLRSRRALTLHTRPVFATTSRIRRIGSACADTSQYTHVDLELAIPLRVPRGSRGQGVVSSRFHGPRRRKDRTSANPEKRGMSPLRRSRAVPSSSPVIKARWLL